jgi:hypothetical protein
MGTSSGNSMWWSFIIIEFPITSNMTLLLSTTMSRTDSNTLKARKAEKANAHRLKLALEVYIAEQLKPKNECCSLHEVVNKFHIDYTTIC